MIEDSRTVVRKRGDFGLEKFEKLRALSPPPPQTSKIGKSSKKDKKSFIEKNKVSRMTRINSGALSIIAFDTPVDAPKTERTLKTDAS